MIQDIHNDTCTVNAIHDTHKDGCKLYAATVSCNY